MHQGQGEKTDSNNRSDWIVCMLSKSSDDSTLGRTVELVKGCHTEGPQQIRGMDWQISVKFNRNKWKDLLLRWNNPCSSTVWGLTG